MKDEDPLETAAAHWFVEVDSAGEDFAAEREFQTWLRGDAAHEAAFARCEAAMLLARRLKEEVEVGRAFEAAARLAAERARPSARPRAFAWCARPAAAWGIAAASVVVALLAVAVDLGPRPDGAGAVAAGRGGPVAAESGAPIAADGAVPITADAEGAAPAIVDTERESQPEQAAGTTTEIAALMAPVVLPGNVVVDARSVAVLPFTTAVDDAAQGGPDGPPRETADTVHKAVVRQLSARPGVYVVGNEAAAPYSSDSIAIEDIAMQLGVRSIAEARVAVSDGRIRIALRLTDAADGRLLIDAVIDRPAEEMGAIPDEIATDIAIALERPTRLTVHQATFQ